MQVVEGSEFENDENDYSFVEVGAAEECHLEDGRLREKDHPKIVIGIQNGVDWILYPFVDKDYPGDHIHEKSALLDPKNHQKDEECCATQ